MEDILGLLLLALYILAIVGLAAGVTFAVIKIFPTQRTPKSPDKSQAPTDGDGAGSLFRRSKRAAT